jgi:hypothetical protein
MSPILKFYKIVLNRAYLLLQIYINLNIIRSEALEYIVVFIQRLCSIVGYSIEDIMFYYINYRYLYYNFYIMNN